MFPIVSLEKTRVKWFRLPVWDRCHSYLTGIIVVLSPQQPFWIFGRFMPRIEKVAKIFESFTCSALTIIKPSLPLFLAFAPSS